MPEKVENVYEFSDLQDECRDKGIPYNDSKSIEELKARLTGKPDKPTASE